MIIHYATSAIAIDILSANQRATSPFQLKPRALLNQSPSSSFSLPNDSGGKSSILLSSLKLLEWDKVCDAVASHAGTSSGREATKALLGSSSPSYEESLKLLAETNAAVEIFKYGDSIMDFSGIDVSLVKSAVLHVQNGLPMDGNEAMAIVALLQFSRALQCNIEAAMKADAKAYKCFMPLSEVIMKMIIDQSVISSIQKVVDEDGFVKDSASPTLKNGRYQVQVLEKKIHQLMGTLFFKEAGESSFQEISNIDGRLCVKFNNDQPTNLKGLLLSSHSGEGTLLEPLVVVPLNDELQKARAVVSKAEIDVLSKLTEKIKGAINEIERLLFDIIELDAINARAIFSVSLGGSFPDLTCVENKNVYFTSNELCNRSVKKLSPTKKEWMLSLPKAYHPLLLWQHHLNMKKAKTDLKNAEAQLQEVHGGNILLKQETNWNPSYLETEVSKFDQSLPVPVDIFIAHQTKVLVISGPNAGGKTIGLKTVGLAGMMAKTGLYVLASEPVRIPWFDYIFADIGDEQSLSESLSTFSGHLKRISDIKAYLTNQSLVLLDEVGVGTNPIEGSALGMSLLEHFAKSALLTISSTHLSELKTLKYRNKVFENACMEFDEVNMKPTYKLLLGIPGRSNAISIAERLGLPRRVLDIAQELYGSTSTNINSVIIDMERIKHDFVEHYHDARETLAISEELYENLLMAERKLADHSAHESYRKAQMISQLAAMAHSVLGTKLRDHSAAAATQSSSQQLSANHMAVSSSDQPMSNILNLPKPAIEGSKSGTHSFPNKDENIVNECGAVSEKRGRIPGVGDMVQLSSIKTKVKVLKVDPSKDELVVQAGFMKLKVKLKDLAAL